MTSKEKSTFRKTPTWKNFRKNFLKEHKFCDVCGQALTKKSNVHHRYPDKYTNLEPANFLACHPHCHKYFHSLAKRKSLEDLDKRLKDLVYFFLPR